jgi:uncharacterized membrane protein YhaH (DUF805 family)
MNSMPSVTLAPRGTRMDLRGWIGRSWRLNWPLTLVGLAMIPTLLLTLVGLAVDPRVITGAPAWLKPAKFALSIGIYSFTFIWMLGFVQGPRSQRLAGWAASLTAVGFAVEMVIIAGQALRGTTSHFNVATPLDSVLFSTMATFIVLLWAAGMVLALILLVQRLPDRDFAWALRLGLLITLVGAGTGFLMTMPTAVQQASWAAGEPVTVAGAHAVGARDDAPGMPITGWSTTGGDLRVGHFFGLHAMQVLPWIGWLLLRRRDRFTSSQRLGLVFSAGFGYLGLVLLTTWQALRGQPLLAPDELTLAVSASLVVATIFGGIASLWLGRRTAA